MTLNGDQRLEDANAAAGSAALYVVDHSGLALASSNWRDPAQSFVGQRYGFRQGLGLGLSLSYGIVRDFGGTLRAENNPDGGACFVVLLPEATHG